MKKNATVVAAAATGTLILAGGLPSVANADLVGVYLLSSQTAPTNASTPPFTVNGTNVFQLSLTGTLATSATPVANLNFDIDQALTYKSHTGTINPWETDGATAAKVNAEVGTWDDVGIITEGSTGDANANTDYTAESGFWLWYKPDAEVIFNGIPTNGFNDLIIAEDAGLDPFQLSLFDDNSNWETVFTGFSDTLRDDLIDLPAFSGGDSSKASEMDQAFVFRFDEAETRHVGVKYNGNFGGEKLEVDFIGVGEAAVVPIPAAAWLFGSALVGMAGIGYRRRSAKA